MLNFQPGGDLWLGDFNGPTRFDSTGTLTQFIPNFGTIDPQVDPSQNLWVSNFANGYIQRFDPAGNFQFASPTPDGSPLGIAVLGVDSASPLPPVDLVDYYSFTLEKNSTATIAVELLSGSPVTVELLSPLWSDNFPWHHVGIHRSGNRRLCCHCSRKVLCEDLRRRVRL